MNTQREVHFSRTVFPVLAGALMLANGCVSLGPHGKAAAVPAFGAMADIQYADKDPWASRHFRASMDKLGKCVADLGARDLAFTIQLGDVIDGYYSGASPADDLARSADDLAAIIGIYRQIPNARHVVGNHCLTAGADTLKKELGLERFYYDFKVREAGGWRFVVLDGNDGGGGIVGEEQMEWFRSILARAAAQGERVICFCHYALVPEAAIAHRMAKPEPVLEAIASAGCVKAWLAGHDHLGGYALESGVHHLTLKGMVEGPSATAYAVVELKPDRITVTGFGTEPSRELMLEGSPTAATP